MPQLKFAPNYTLAYNNYAKLCAPTISCDVNAKYRSINGSCNNLKTPWFGASITPHLRILDAYYDDGKCCIKLVIKLMQLYDQY